MPTLKKLSARILFLALIVTMVPKESGSQNLEITNCVESNYPLCTSPDTSRTTTFIYNYGPFGLFADSVSLYYDFGDGTDSTYWFTSLTLPAGGVYVMSMDHIYTTSGVYAVTVILTGPANADTASHVVVVAPGCGTFTGYTYIDNNANCIFDAGDDTLRYFTVYLTDSSSTFSAMAVSDGMGVYSLAVANTIGYIASVIPGAFNLANACPASGLFGFTGTASTTNYDFGMNCLPGFDASITMTATPAVPGTDLYADLFAQNLSCTPVSGTITLTHDSLLTYVSSTTTPASITSTTITWNYTNLDVQTGAPTTNGITEHITFLTNSSAVLGDTLLLTADISPVTGDINALNNTWPLIKIVGSSFDPNMKEVSPAGVGPTGNVVPQTEFTYTVHFQNTGTSPAMNIQVVDTLDADLDLTTFTVITSSHPMTAGITNGNVLTAAFNNINLPDSTSNEPASHGWFMYKVRAKAGLANGTPIENTANIFFDFNPAVVTNTTLNTIDIAMGVNNTELNNTSGMLIYPNPVSNAFTLAVNQPLNATVLIIDMTGKIVKTGNINGTTATVDVNELPAGIYQVIIPGNSIKMSRFQKLK